MVASMAQKVVLVAVLMVVALKDIGNADWASQADETDDASHLALDENFFQDSADESSGLEVDGTSEQPSILGEKGTTTATDKDVTATPSEIPTPLEKETPFIEKDGHDTDLPSAASTTRFEQETTASSEKNDFGTGTPSEIPQTFEETTMSMFGKDSAVGSTSEIPSTFGEEATDFIGEAGEGSGIDETTIPPALTELITEGNKDAEAQLKTTQATESPDHKTFSGTRSEGPTPTVIPTLHTEEKTGASEPTDTVVTEKPPTTSVTRPTTAEEKLESSSPSRSSVLSSSGPVTGPLSTESAETSESTIVTDRPTSIPETSSKPTTVTYEPTKPETEPKSAEAHRTTDQPTATTETIVIQTSTYATPTTAAVDETSTSAEHATSISPTTDGGAGESNIRPTDSVNKSDPCSRTFCKNGYMCEPTENGESAECRCPSECPQSATPCCSVYMEEYSSICEMHQQACGLGLNIALRNMGKCSDIQSGSGYLPTIVPEELAPASKCSREEVMQFASRFQEWAMINKELAEGTGSAQVDLNTAILQARTNGLSSVERRQILKYQFTAMDKNVDRHLDKSEVEAFLRFVPSEHCLYGFMVSSDVDRNAILSRDEWYEAFGQFQDERFGINFGSKL